MDSIPGQGVGEDPDILPISRHSLHGELVERLRNMIIEGKLAPGSRINEGQLAGKLGVSRTPMREAIKFVASEGLIDLVPGRGALIKALTLRDVEEMLEVLTVLETTAARIACRTATAMQISALRLVHKEMMRWYERRNRLEYHKCDQAIHTGIVRLSGNGFLAAQHETIQVRLKRIRFLGIEAPEKWGGAVAEHEAMMVALEARDGDGLTRVLTEHLERTWDRVRESI